MDERVDMTPVGMARRDDSTEVNPKFLMMMPLKVINPVKVSDCCHAQCHEIFVPPLGMLMAMLKKKISQVFGSIRASMA